MYGQAAYDLASQQRLHTALEGSDSESDKDESPMNHSHFRVEGAVWTRLADVRGGRL